VPSIVVLQDYRLSLLLKIIFHVIKVYICDIGYSVFIHYRYVSKLVFGHTYYEDSVLSIKLGLAIFHVTEVKYPGRPTNCRFTLSKKNEGMKLFLRKCSTPLHLPNQFVSL
jgi:hypothetical protein